MGHGREDQGFGLLSRGSTPNETFLYLCVSFGENQPLFQQMGSPFQYSLSKDTVPNKGCNTQLLHKILAQCLFLWLYVFLDQLIVLIRHLLCF